MFASYLTKTQVLVTVALLVLCFTIAPHSGYPHAENDEDQVATRADLDSEDHEEEAYDEGASVGDDNFFLEDTIDKENDPKSDKPRCAEAGEKCIDLPACCPGKSLECIKRKGMWQGNCLANP